MGGKSRQVLAATNLSATNLSATNLSATNLSVTNLSVTNLSVTNLSAIGRNAARCFGDADPGDACGGGEGSAEAGVEFLGEVPGDVLSAGVELIERGCGVEIGVDEGVDDLVQEGFDGVEIAEETIAIEGVPLDAGGDAEVVAVDHLALTGDDEGVGSAELVVDGEREHGGL